MSYSETFSIKLPASLLAIANNIVRSLDPDLGGADTFTIKQTGSNPDNTPIYSDTISMTTACEPQFKAQAGYLLANPDALHAQIVLDYATRWPTLPVPTLSDVVAFCSGVIAEVVIVAVVP